MSNDLLREFQTMREALKQEKTELEARLTEIDQALGQTVAGRQSRRIRNTLSLKEAVIKVTSERPLSKEEILEEVQKLGYQFNTTNPVNSLNVILYGRKPKFKRDGRRFMLARK